MAKKLSLFPTISKKKAKELFTIPLPILSYSRNGIQYNLTLNEPDSIQSSISDENGFWNADEYDLQIDWKFTCQHGNLLYGADNWEYACACQGAVIGVALCWYSKDSKRRYTIPFGIIKNDTSLQPLSASIHFNPSELRGIIGVSIILYIQTPGTPSEDDGHFANEIGVVLGEIENFEICLDGTGSFFTIYEVNRPGEPLWEVEYNIDDPSTDQFSDCVSICLNRAHKKYPLVQKGGNLFCQQLFIEIVANAMSIIIETVRAHEKDDTVDCLNNYDEGSVSQALSYFKDVLLWDFSSPISVSKSARTYIEKNIRKYENIRI